MHHIELGFGFFAYLIDWLGFSAREESPLDALNTTTVRPIGG